jgi:two-component system sensor kinase FixL
MTIASMNNFELLHHLPIGLVVWVLPDLQDASSFQLIEINQVAQQILNLPPEMGLQDAVAYQNQTAADPFPAFLKIEPPEVYATAIRNKMVRDLGEIRYRDRQQIEQFFAIKLVPLPEQHLVAMFENVTNRRQIEAQLSAERERVNGILDIAKDAIISIGEDQRIQLFNRGAEQIFEYAATDVIGKSIDILLPYNVQTRHRQHIRNFGQSQTISRQMGDRQEVYGRRRDGSEFPAEASISKFTFHQEHIYTVILRDITERKQAEMNLKEKEEFLRSIYEGVEQSIFVVDIEEDGTFRYVDLNPAHARLTGISPDQLQGKTPGEVLPPAIASEVIQHYQDCLAAGTHITYEECIPFHGQESWWMTRLYPLRDAQQRIYRLIGTSINITDRKRMEQDLRDFTRRLEQSNRELQDFAFVASHDLQEPLRKIQAFGDRLKAKCADVISPEGQDYLERMQNAARRMQILINDLLSFSRVTSRAQPFALVDLNQVLREVLSDMEIHLQQVAAQLDISELPILEADAMQMRQLLQNLISNALKFHKPDQPPVIHIHGQHISETHCQIAIADEGIGFDPKYGDRIFTIFQRLHGRSDYEGTGIGLAICRKIVERHQGTVTATSQPGQGAMFTITLPRQQLP